MTNPESSLSTTGVDMSTITWQTQNVSSSLGNQVLTSANIPGYVNNARYQIVSQGESCFMEFQFDSTPGFQYIGLSETIDVQTDYNQYSAANIYGLKKEFNTVLLCVDGTEVGSPLGNLDSTYIVLYDGANVHIFKDKVLVSSTSKQFTGPIYAGTTIYGGFGDAISVSKLSVGTYDGNQISSNSVSVSNVSTSWVNNQVILSGTVNQTIQPPATLLLGNTPITIQQDLTFEIPVTTQSSSIYFTDGDSGIMYLIGIYNPSPIVISRTFNDTTNTLTIVTPKLTGVTSYNIYTSNLADLIQTVTSSEWTDNGTTITLPFTIDPTISPIGVLASIVNNQTSETTPIVILYPNPSDASISAQGEFDGITTTTLTNLSVSGTYDGIVIAKVPLTTQFAGRPIPIFVSELNSMSGFDANFVRDVTPEEIQSGSLSFINTTTVLYLYPYTKNNYGYTLIDNGIEVQLSVPPPPPAILDPQPAVTFSTDTSITISYVTVPAFNSVYSVTDLPAGKVVGDTLETVPQDAIELIASSPTEQNSLTYPFTDLTPNTPYTYYIIWKFDDGTNPVEITIYQQKDVTTFKSIPGTITVTSSSVSSGTVTVNYEWTGDQSDKILVTDVQLDVLTRTTDTIEALTTDKQGGPSKLVADVVSGTSSISFSGSDNTTYYLYPYNSGDAGLSFAEYTTLTLSSGGGGGGGGGNNNVNYNTTSIVLATLNTAEVGSNEVIYVPSGLSYVGGEQIVITDPDDSSIKLYATVTQYFLDDGGDTPMWALQVTITSIVGVVSDSPKLYTVALSNGGGGDGGGSGGNNGGTGHNNMATLEFAYTGYEGDVSQTNKITILGEEGGALTGTEIAVNVPLASFKKVLQYKNNWETEGDAAGEQPLPGVLFRPLEASTPLNTMFDKLKVKGTGAEDSSTRQWKDDADATQYVFGNELLKVSFTDSALDSQNLPRESIRKIEEGDLTVDSLTGTVLSNLDSETAELPGSTKSLLEGLFEQAVSAGRVVGTDGAGEAGYKCPSFVVGDSISFLVKYTFSKQRDYVLDSDVTSGNTTTGARKTFTVAGTTFDIDGENETASSSKTYIIKLVATA